MNAEQNIETARQMYLASGRGDLRAVLDRVTGDVVWSTGAAIQSAQAVFKRPECSRLSMVSFTSRGCPAGPAVALNLDCGVPVPPNRCLYRGNKQELSLRTKSHDPGEADAHSFGGGSRAGRP
jgi:hypothetical protein